MSGAPMALTVINKINCELCNALIQPHFDYTCPAWYPNLTGKKEKEVTNYAKLKHNAPQNASHILR